MNPLNRRRSRLTRRCHPVLVVALLSAMSLAACGDNGDGRQGADISDASTPAPSPSPTMDARQDATSDGTPIRITFGDTALTGRLHDNATARSLAAQLPLTLSFRDHNNVEKTAPLPQELSIDDAPAGHDPAAGDIGYWAPDGDLVLYHDSDAPFFDGIVRIGELDGDLAAVKQLPEGTRVTIDATS
jgi:hypothetical protein